MNILRKFLNKYVYEDWNIAVADIADDFSPINVKWMKHDYKDRWFADPFILKERKDAYIVLAEECMHSTQKGRLVCLTVDKEDCRLLKNETILELSTHLSFPNPIRIGSDVMIYPENEKGGNTKYYKYSSSLEYEGILSKLALTDPVIASINGSYFLFTTIGDGRSGNVLQIFKSDEPLNGYKNFSEIVFSDNIARRAGNLFVYKGKLISPAQICNEGYGKGISLQEVKMNNGKIEVTEFKRLCPPTKDYKEGFHTYNVFGNKVIIDGYRYGSNLLHKLYFRLRK